MNLSLMLSEGDADELVVVATLEREKAVVTRSLMPSGGKDEELVLDVAVERDEAGENASLQLADNNTNNDAWSISYQLVFACIDFVRFLKDFVVG